MSAAQEKKVSNPFRYVREIVKYSLLIDEKNKYIYLSIIKYIFDTQFDFFHEFFVAFQKKKKS